MLTIELPSRARLWGRLIRSRGARFGLIVLALLAVIAIIGPWIVPHNPNTGNIRNKLLAPSGANWFGTDELGRDLLSRTIYGTRAAMLTAGGAGLIAASVGVPLGLISGYYGKWRDTVIMRFMNVMLAFPAILLALLIVAVLGRGRIAALLAVGIVGIPGMARVVRSEVLSLRSREFVTAVESAGASNVYAMFRTVLPHTRGSIITQIIIVSGSAVFLDAVLSFLGLGVPPPAATWGDMLRVGKSYLRNDPYYALLPGMVLTLTIAAIDSLGRALTNAVGRSSDTGLAGATRR